MNEKTSEAIAELMEEGRRPSARDQLEGLMSEGGALYREVEAVLYRAKNRVLCAPAAHRAAMYKAFLVCFGAAVSGMRHALLAMDDVRRRELEEGEDAR